MMGITLLVVFIGVFHCVFAEHPTNHSENNSRNNSGTEQNQTESYPDLKSHPNNLKMHQISNETKETAIIAFKQSLKLYNDTMDSALNNLKTFFTKIELLETHEKAKDDSISQVWWMNEIFLLEFLE